MVHVALAIAGSEATGGAGAQTDLKTFHQLGTFGATALTCIVSFDPKNSFAHRFVPVDPQVIADQIEANVGTHEIDTVKIGMLGHPATIDTVASALEQYAFTNVVLDPVLFCKEVGEQTTPAARTDQALIQKILPFATFVTPNLDETAILAGLPGAGSITSVEDLTAAARAIHERSGAAVLAKGGVGLPGDEAVDVFVDGDQVIELRSPKVGQERVNGAGCTLAAAVTAEIAKGATPLEAARTAKAPFDAVYQGGYNG
jgi:pyridoxine kinase